MSRSGGEAERPGYFWGSGGTTGIGVAGLGMEKMDGCGRIGCETSYLAYVEWSRWRVCSGRRRPGIPENSRYFSQESRKIKEKRIFGKKNGRRNMGGRKGKEKKGKEWKGVEWNGS